MELELENVNILDEIFFEKVKSTIINADLDKNKEYDIEIKFDEMLCISEEMYKYFIYKIPPEKLRKHIKNKKVSGVNDCSIYAGEVLSYILENILLLLETDIKIRNSKIIGAMYYRKNNTKITLIDSDKESEFKVKSIMPSESSFCENLKKGMEKIIKDRSEKEQEKISNKRDNTKKEIPPDVDASVSINIIAKQLGVSEEKLQEFINSERNNR